MTEAKKIWKRSPALSQIHKPPLTVQQEHQESELKSKMSNGQKGIGHSNSDARSTKPMTQISTEFSGHLGQ